MVQRGARGGKNNNIPLDVVQKRRADIKHISIPLDVCRKPALKHEANANGRRRVTNAKVTMRFSLRNCYTPKSGFEEIAHMYTLFTAQLPYLYVFLEKELTLGPFSKTIVFLEFRNTFSTFRIGGRFKLTFPVVSRHRGAVAAEMFRTPPANAPESL